MTSISGGHAPPLGSRGPWQSQDSGEGKSKKLEVADWAHLLFPHVRYGKALEEQADTQAISSLLLLLKDN